MKKKYSPFTEVTFILFLVSVLKSDIIGLIFQNTINGKDAVYRILLQKYVKNITQALMVLPSIPCMEKNKLCTNPKTVNIVRPAWLLTSSFVFTDNHRLSAYTQW